MTEAEYSELSELFRQMPIGRLKLKNLLYSYVINAELQEEQPRHSRLDELREEQRILNEVLTEKIRKRREMLGEPEPEPVTVGMSTLTLTGKALRR